MPVIAQVRVADDVVFQLEVSGKPLSTLANIFGVNTHAILRMITPYITGCIINVTNQLMIHSLSGAPCGRAAGIALQAGPVADHLTASALVADVPGEATLYGGLARPEARFEAFL